MGAYNRADFDNPAIYSKTCIAVLELFPDTVIEAVTDPAKGIQTTSAYPPRVAELRARAERCEASLKAIELCKARKISVDKFRCSQPKEVDRSNRPSIDDLRAKHSYWLGPECGERLREDDDRMRGAAKRKPAFRSLAEIAAECGVTTEQLDAIPDASLQK